MNEDMDVSSYSLTHESSCDGSVVHMAKNFNDYTTWPSVLHLFATFISAVYGYNVKDRIAVLDREGNEEKWVPLSEINPEFLEQ